MTENMRPAWYWHSGGLIYCRIEHHGHKATKIMTADEVELGRLHFAEHGGTDHAKDFNKACADRDEWRGKAYAD